MQRKPGFPTVNCSIKLPEAPDISIKQDPDLEVNPQKRQTLINYGHLQWGFDGWSWSVTKQELDFVDYNNGTYSVGVAAYVSVTVKSLDIHRCDVGYANTTATKKGSAIHNARKCAVTNALRETLLSFGGQFATDLMELLEINKTDQNSKPNEKTTSEIPTSIVTKVQNPHQNEVKNAVHIQSRNIRKDSSDSNISRDNNVHINPVKNPPSIKNIVPANIAPPPINNNSGPPTVNSTFPVNHGPQKPAMVPPMPHVRPNSNVSFVLQPVMQGMMPYGPPSTRMPVPSHVYPNAYYTEYAPWGFSYDGFDHRQLSNVNYSAPPKNLVMNGRAFECKNNHGNKVLQPGEHDMNGYVNYGPNQGCWIKPTIFYDGFWTEQKVKKWVSEQTEKQCLDDIINKFSPPVANGSPNQIACSKV